MNNHESFIEWTIDGSADDINAWSEFAACDAWDAEVFFGTTGR